MFRFGKHYDLAAALLLVMTLASYGCSERITPPGSEGIDLSIRMSILAPGQATQVSRYLLTVTGPGILEPITADMDFSDGYLSVGIVVPAGPARLFHIDCLDEGGRVLYSGETLADVVGGSEFILNVDLRPRVQMIKTSPAYVETMQGDLIAMKIRCYMFEDLAEIRVRLYSHREIGNTYIYFDSIVINPEIRDLVWAETWMGEGGEAEMQIGLYDWEMSFVGEDGYVELATVYYQTGMYEVSPLETATFEPAVRYMFDKQENELPLEMLLAEGSTVLLYDFWDRLIGYWTLSLSEITSRITDYSGNNLNGTVTGTTIVDGVVGDGRYFDGVDDYITIPDNNLLDLRNEITLSMWVYINSPDAMSTTPLSSLICKGSEGGPVNYQLLIENLSATDGYSTVYFRYGSSGQHTYRADIPNRLSTGWFHLVFSYRFGDPSSAIFSAGYQCRYMETLPGAWVDGTGTEQATVTGSNLYIGRDMTMDRFFFGYLDEVIISDKTWTLPVIKYYNVCYR